MSKGKQARFHLKSHETLLKKGMMDYCVTGEYRHFVAGDAYLTDARFFFGAELETGEYLSFECPLPHIYSVEAIGVPFFTRSMLVATDEKSYRLNAFFVGRWVRALNRALAASKQAQAQPQQEQSQQEQPQEK